MTNAVAVMLSAAAIVGAGIGCSSGAAAAPVGMSIDTCVVYSARDPGRRFDCTAGARRLCNGKAMCELPIGEAVSDGQDIDPLSDKKVKVRLTCATRTFVEGPHDQDDHAAMILVCPG
ncbi:MAG TPA: hypothetical protein VHB68_08570 [Steroidobacteraceae bacterium]|nr:hypothetical protein [Steroidobacteraceae bacterium]